MAAENLLLTGGYLHPFDSTAPLLAEVLSGAGIESDVTDDIDEGLRRLADGGGYRLVTVYALRWPMTHPRFDDERTEWAFSLSDSGRTALLEHLAGGGGILAMHTAAICFDDWPAWSEVVGASWNWERSFHPPSRPMRIDVASVDHPLVDGLSGFEVEDEIYSFLDWQDDARPLATCHYRGADQPLLVAREVNGGRVAYDALGHDEASLSHPTHQTIVRRAGLWALGRPDEHVRSVQ